MSVNVTDYEWYDPRLGKHRTGYYMDEFLTENLMGIPKYLDKAWDVVGIVSGHGKVRIGKSTMALQVAYFIAWMLAGGRMNKVNNPDPPLRSAHKIPGSHKVPGSNASKWIWYVSEKPKKKITFSIEENIVFSP